MITEKDFVLAIHKGNLPFGEDADMAAKDCYELAKQMAFDFHKYFINFCDKAMKGEDIRDFECASLEQRWEMFELYLKSKQ